MLKQDDYFEANELGLDELNPRVSVDISEIEDDSENVLAVVNVSEDLRFHVELERKTPFEPPVFDSEGLLTEQAYEALEAVLKDRYNGEYLQEHGDIPEQAWIEFQITLTVPAGTSAEDLGTLIWEKTELVKFHNEADPGTFGSPYLFGSLIAEAMKE